MPASHPRASDVFSAFCLASLGELGALALFLIMLAVWCGVGSGRI
jgi:hypothetical protein